MRMVINKIIKESKMQREFKMHENGKTWDAEGAGSRGGVQKINLVGLWAAISRVSCKRTLHLDPTFSLFTLSFPQTSVLSPLPHEETRWCSSLPPRNRQRWGAAARRSAVVDGGGAAVNTFFYFFFCSSPYSPICTCLSTQNSQNRTPTH